MNDTTPEFRRIMDERYARLTPAERVLMCAEMFDTAQALVRASLPEGLAPAELRFRICQRFYGDLAERAFPRR